MFYRAHGSGGHRYETALDFLFLPNDLKGPPISPLTPRLYYSILSLPLSHHPSPPNFPIRPCFLNVMLDAQTQASHQHLPLSSSLSGSPSLPLCYCPCSVALFASLCFSLNLRIRLLLLSS